MVQNFSIARNIKNIMKQTQMCSFHYVLIEFFVIIWANKNLHFTDEETLSNWWGILWPGGFFPLGCMIKDPLACHTNQSIELYLPVISE